jgi:hypothetical protein
MTQQPMVPADKEIWESTIPGRIAVTTIDDRGRERTQSILGKGQRLRVTAEERAINEERIRDQQNNPFRNGMLLHINRKPAEEPSGDGEGSAAPSSRPSDQELSDDELAATFEFEGDDFADAVRALSEVNVRRLKVLAAERDAKTSQVVFINSHIEETWPIGGDTPTYREMQGAPQ